MKYAELNAHISAVESSFSRDVGAAFFMGGFSFLVIFAAVRGVASFRDRHVNYSYTSMDTLSRETTDCTLDGELAVGTAVSARQIHSDPSYRAVPSLE